MSTRRWAGWVGAVVLVAVAAGCSGNGSNQSTSSRQIRVVDATYASTTSARTARVSLVATVRPPNGAAIATTGEGVMDFSNKAYDVTMHLPTGSTSDARVVGSVEYVTLPPSSARSPALRGKHWISHPAGSTGLLSNTADDPGQILGYLRGVSTAVVEVGTEDVRGTPTTHYRASVDLTKAAAHESPQGQAADRRLEAALGRKTLPVDVWTDSQGRARRLRFQVPLPSSREPGTATATSRLNLTLDIYDFGVPVAVQAPPASEVYSSALSPPDTFRRAF